MHVPFVANVTASDMVFLDHDESIKDVDVVLPTYGCVLSGDAPIESVMFDTGNRYNILPASFETVKGPQVPHLKISISLSFRPHLSSPGRPSSDGILSVS
jgi:hypothetical protein